MQNWFNQLCLLYSGCYILMSIAICAIRYHRTVYSKQGCPLAHSCHYRLKQSCHRRLVCPTSLLRQSITTLITEGLLALCANEFFRGSWLLQPRKSNRRTFLWICCLRPYYLTSEWLLWPRSPEYSLLDIAFHQVPLLRGSLFFLLPGLHGQQY